MITRQASLDLFSPGPAVAVAIAGDAKKFQYWRPADYEKQHAGVEPFIVSLRAFLSPAVLGLPAQDRS